MARRTNIRNVARGGGKLTREAVQGLKQLEAKLRDLLPSNPKMAQAVSEVVGDAAQEVRSEIQAQAMLQQWPQEILRYVFGYREGKPAGSRNKIAALAGVSKGHKNPAHPMYKEWRAGRHPKSPNAKVGPGGKVGMGWPTMWEFGTSNRPARPAVRPAIKNARARVIEIAAKGYSAILEQMQD